MIFAVTVIEKLVLSLSRLDNRAQLSIFKSKKELFGTHREDTFWSESYKPRFFSFCFDLDSLSRVSDEKSQPQTLIPTCILLIIERKKNFIDDDLVVVR